MTAIETPQPVPSVAGAVHARCLSPGCPSTDYTLDVDGAVPWLVFFPCAHSHAAAKFPHIVPPPPAPKREPAAPLRSPSTTQNPGPGPYRDRDIGTGQALNAEAILATVKRIWQKSEPLAREWAILDLVPLLHRTILYADGGLGKSYVALYLLMLALLGRDFAGREVRRIKVGLYIDAELDELEFTRRAFTVARGLGLERPPEGLLYWNPPGPLSDPKVNDAARLVLTATKTELYALDSLTIASYGTDAKEQADMTAILKSIEQWGSTGILIDHPPAPKPGVNTSTYRPFGTTFKYNLARSVLQLVKADGGGLVLRQTKSNFGPLAAPVNLVIEHYSDTVTFEVVASTDERMAGAEEHLPAPERVYRTLADRGSDGGTPEQLAEELGISVKTAKNHLTALKRAGRATNAQGKWWSRSPDSIETGIGTSGVS